MLSPLDVSWFRFALAFTSLVFFHLITKPASLRILIKPPPLMILAGIFLGFNYLGLITGIHFTTPAIGEIFIQSGAVFLAVAGFFLFREKTTLLQKAGLLIVVVGLGIFYREQLLVLAGHVTKYQKGVGLTLFAGFMWASYAIIQKKLVVKFDPLTLNLVLFGVPSIGLIPFVDFSSFGTLPAEMWGVIIFLGLNTLIAYGALAFALKYLDANKVSVIVTLNPVITFTLLAILMELDVTWVVKEHFTLLTLTGASMVVAGAVLNILRLKNTR